MTGSRTGDDDPPTSVWADLGLLAAFLFGAVALMIAGAWLFGILLRLFGLLDEGIVVDPVGAFADLSGGIAVLWLLIAVVALLNERYRERGSA